ncbi:hypothetical protein NQ318_021048 [Aromia moschata]|uniref:DUF5641 domain-containing protein n=1 Tax=Aromia moschata TaxID=1265417 RepID=A0AAV8Y8R5_9CUCU|nr:hypothetical protein NQ318_021048 [Aromia moschata]
MRGLWESAVKSAKQHLKHVLNNIFPAYEEFYTLTTQIESILNSRPLYPLSTDPKDYTPLTPGHFLVGEALNCIPQECPAIEGTHLSRYEHFQRIIHHFWKRWSHDYLHLLQQRTKWRFVKDVPALEGSLVLLKDDNTSPQAWPMGRIIDVQMD